MNIGQINVTMDIERSRSRSWHSLENFLHLQNKLVLLYLSFDTWQDIVIELVCLVEIDDTLLTNIFMLNRVNCLMLEE